MNIIPEDQKYFNINFFLHFYLYYDMIYLQELKT
jgi:hypothetical protein